MGTRKLFLLKSHYGLVDKSFLDDFVHSTMFWSATSFWVFLSNYMFYVLGFIIRYIFRFDGDENSRKIDSDCSAVQSQQDNLNGSNCFKELEPRVSEDFNMSNGDTECSVSMETGSTACTSKYQFMSKKDISGFIEEPQTMSFTVQGLFVGSNDDSISKITLFDSGCCTDKDIPGLNSETVAVNQEKTEDFAESFNSEKTEVSTEKAEDSAESFSNGKTEYSAECFSSEQTEDSAEKTEECAESSSNAKTEDSAEKTEDSAESFSDAKTEDSAESLSSEEVLEKQEQVKCTGVQLSEKAEIAGLENNFLGQYDLSDEVQLLPETSDSKQESNSDGMVTSTHEVDSINDETCIPTDEQKTELTEEIPCLAQVQLYDTFIADPEAISEDDFIELEPHSSVFDREFLTEQDFVEAEDKHESNDLVIEEREATDDSEESEEPSLLEKISVLNSDDQMGLEDNSKESEEPSLQEKPSVVLDSDDELGFEFLQEHEDLIQQLKIELKNVKNRGLPTILEESESPKMVEDLKPLKIDKKLEYKDRMEEIQNFYKSYVEKMRKLDILNNQTMHAIGLLRLKDPVQFNSSRKSSVPAIKSLLSWNIRTSKVGNHEADPTQKFIRELHRNLEMVYVGQICLSWEILYWQYGKAQELQDYDTYGAREYNQVADEYQQFQVLVRRFIETEPFQGPCRVQNYIEKRSVLCSHLLQVPAIRDDCLKDKKARKEEGEYVISSTILAKTIEESMRLFWEFLHADKDEAYVISRGVQGTQVDLIDPADLELLMDIQTILQKKEKRLKDSLRSRNCIVKRFQKHQEHEVNLVLLFAQVEMKLVSRVLNLSRLTTDQLVWCHKKLNQIKFVSNKIYIEHSFLLFPC